MASFEGEIILLCVHWYLRYSLSYRDLAEMMAERGLKVTASTICRWVLTYAPELEKWVKPPNPRRVESRRDVCQGQGRVAVSGFQAVD